MSYLDYVIEFLITLYFIINIGFKGFAIIYSYNIQFRNASLSIFSLNWIFQENLHPEYIEFSGCVLKKIVKNGVCSLSFDLSVDTETCNSISVEHNAICLDV